MNSKNSTIIFFFGILIIGAITNPNYDAHKREVTRAIIPETEIDANDPWGTLGQSLGSKMAGGLLDKYFSVSNYLIISVGKIKYQGNKKTVSIGFLGNVISFESNNPIQGNSNQSKRKTTYEQGFDLNDNYKQKIPVLDYTKRTGERIKESAEKIKIETQQNDYNDKSKKVLIFESDRFKVTCEQNYVDGDMVAFLELDNLTSARYSSVWFMLKGVYTKDYKPFEKRIRFSSVQKYDKRAIEQYIYDELIHVEMDFLKVRR